VTEGLAAVAGRPRGAVLPQEAVDAALRLVTSLAQRTVGSSVGAGVTLVTGGLRLTTAASHPLVERADGLQYGLDEGPCLTAWRDRTAVRIDEMRTERRWPRWTRAAAPLGMRACLSAPVIAGADVIGAIKVYSRDSAVYGEPEEEILHLFAQQVAILLGPARHGHRSGHEAFRDMLRSRDVVIQARGMLMARQDVGEPAAFALLVRHSQRCGTSVREAARDLVGPGGRGRRDA
jgi:GAF domain-containing protein